MTSQEPTSKQFDGTLSMDSDKVYWRLYDAEKTGPTVVCVQWFDIADYGEARWLDDQLYLTEWAAEQALKPYLLSRSLESGITFEQYGSESICSRCFALVARCCQGQHVEWHLSR